MRGDPSKEGLHKKEPLPPSGRIEPPDYVEGLALAKWNEIAPKIEAMGLLTTCDLEPLARYCVIYEQWRKYLDQVRRGLDVIVMKDEAGKVRYMQVGPAATMFKSLATELLRLEAEFGLTPSARASIDVPYGEVRDTLQAYINGTA